ncbi:hypothetical protein DL770_004498 [Monosporascus sp. CRB-9-2]|nr:hypothetical protein DL770_004498 [Monosporascus sp. CRB-9-2]
MFDEVPDKDPYGTDPAGNKQGDANKKLKAILNTWRDDVLMTSKSQYVITTGEDGWLSSEALLSIAADTNATGEKELAFGELFECDRTNMQEHDTLWLKGEPYSVAETLNHHEEASKFVGDTVYQAFGYITHAATRAIFPIDTETALGTVCAIYVG